MSRPRTLPVWAVIVSLWLAFGLARAISTVASFTFAPGPARPAAVTLLEELASALLFAALTPLVLRVWRLHRNGAAPFARIVALHAPTCLLVSASHELLHLPIRLSVRRHELPWPEIEATLRDQSLIRVAVNATVYLGLLASLVTTAGYRRARDAAAAAARLEAELAAESLSRVTSGLQPEAFFTSLDRIVSCLRTRPEEAEERVVALGDELRRSLEEARRAAGRDLRSSAGESAPGSSGSSRSA